ncbi:hypothetical protein L0222_23795 [bacterium]|nr:hypothetical protein [bacterium]
MEAAIWEIRRRHGLVTPRSWIQYLLSTGCKYWIVNRDGDQAYWFQTYGLSRFLWLKENEVAAQGPIGMYKLPSLQTALMLFDNRVRAGTDLVLNGDLRLGDFSSDKCWTLENGANWIKSKKFETNVNDLLLLPPRAGFSQHVPLPSGLTETVLTSRVKAVSPNGETTFMLSILWKDENVKPFSSIEREFVAQANWHEEKTTVVVPPAAVWAEFSIHHTGGDSHLLVDELHMYSK